MENKETARLRTPAAPHIASPKGTKHMMRDVLIALVPALCMAAYFFGPRVLALTAVSVAGCVFFEWGYRKLMKKSNTCTDLSAIITGVLLAFVCPVSLPYWMILVGDFFAIVVVKQLFGGLGKNFLNPALAGRAFLMLCYPTNMTHWITPTPGSWVWSDVTTKMTDAVTGATPLSSQLMKNGTLPNVELADLFIGNMGGSIGEVSALALLLGALYLLCRGVMRFRIPLSFVGTVAILTVIFPQGNDNVEWMLYQLLSGGLILGACFMAADYTTTPVTKKGEWMFGIGCGLLTVFIRYFGGYAEGVSYAILLMNVCASLFDKIGHPARFGEKKKEKADVQAVKGGQSA